MADSTTVDSIGIEIDYAAKGAESGLSKLNGTLQELSNTVGPAVNKMNTMKNGINNVQSSAQTLNTINFTQFTNNVKSLQKGIEPLTQLGKGGLSNIISSISKLPETMSTFQNVDLSNFESFTEKLEKAIKPLTQLGKTNLGSFINQLNRIPELNKNLDPQIIETFTKKIVQLSKAMQPLANNMAKVTAGFSSFPSKINKVVNSTNKLTNATQKSNLQNIASLVNFSAITAIAAKVGDVFGSFVDKSVKYTEDMNLFTVAMGKSAEKANDFVDTFSEALSIDPSNMMRYMGVFQMLASGFGLANDKAYIMSKNLTQLTYDLSSFYNIQIDEAAQKLQSALAGELEPVRRLGYALDQATLKQIAYNNGITESITNMTQAEKAQLRYIALLTQNTQVQGDIARTLYTPANAIRVLKQQFELLSREIGNIFIPILIKIIPIVTAVVKVLTLLARTIAGLFGFKLPEIDYSSVQEVAGGFEDIEDSANGAAGAAQKAKRQLQGFDELNNLTTPTPSSGKGGAGGVGGGANFDLDLPEYDALKGLNKQIDDMTDKIKRFFGISEDGAGKFKINFWDMDDRAKILLGTLGLIAGAKGIGKVTKAIDTIKGIKITSWIGSVIGKLFGFTTVFGDISFAIEAVAGGAATIPEAFGYILGTLPNLLLSIGAFASLVSSILSIFKLIETFNTDLYSLTGATDLFSDTIDSTVNGPLLGLHFAFKKVDKTISDTTKDAIIPFMEKYQELGTTIMGLTFKDIVTEDDVNSVKSQTQEIANTLQTNLIDRYTEMENTLNDTKLFPDEEKRKEYLNKLNDSLKEEQDVVELHKNSINSIVEKAANEHRNLTDVEREQINGIQKQMGETGIKLLTENEAEQIAIQTRFNDKFDNLTQEQITNYVGKAKELKDKAVAEAEDEYDKRVALAENMKRTIPDFTEEMYNQMIDDATDAKNKSIKEAEDQYQGIVDKVNEKYPAVAKTIDFENGKIKNGWQITADTITGKFEEIGEKLKLVWLNLKGKIIEIRTDIEKGFVNLQKKALEIFNNLKNGITEKMQGVMNWFSEHFKLPSLEIPKLPNIGLKVTFYDDGSLISKAAKVLGLSGKPTFDFYTYATGGFPSTGEFFMARENGPELVGRVGNKTAVANNDQIISGISQGVYNAFVNAQGSTGGNGTTIYIGNKKVYSSFSNGLRTENNRLGTNTIRV